MGSYWKPRDGSFGFTDLAGQLGFDVRANALVVPGRIELTR